MAYIPKKRVAEVTKVKGKHQLPLTKLDLVAEYVAFADCTRDEALSRVDGVLACVRSLLSRTSETEGVDEVVLTLNNFGKFTMKHVPAHTHVCNHNGLVVDVPDKRKLLFAPAKAWMDVLKDDM